MVARHSLPNSVYHVSWQALSAIAFLLASSASAAETYLPTDEDEVLETLPRSLLAGWDELATLRRQLAADSGNLELATSVATRYLRLGSVEGDPRLFGYARAAIDPWWDTKNAPAEILSLRAKLREKDHQYDQALEDLKLLRSQQPGDVQAWVETVNIYRVQGKYTEAFAVCEAMGEHAGSVRTLLCEVPIRAMTGQAAQAYEALAKLLPVARQRWPEALPWVITMQANVAWALGSQAAAEKHFVEGLALDPRNTYLLRTYADFLLDGDREHEVLPLLRKYISDNGVLLRAAIAARRAGESELASQWQSQLEIRFEELRLRGSEPHGRYEARYHLDLKNNRQRALAVGLANWQKQKETRDTRNVLEAALAANDRRAAEPVLEFLRLHNTEDVVLQKLVKQLESVQ